jgi:membrane associated rhomboid family serine protease
MSETKGIQSKADREAYLDLVHRQVRLVEMMNKPVVLTWWLLVINVVFWIAAKTYGIWLGDQGLGTAYLNAEQLTFWTGLKLNYAISDGQWWRLISSQFAHLDMLHLLFNAYGIFVLGRFFERCYGLRRMLVLYLASGTVGALASFIIYDSPAGGASGAVYGLVGGVVVFGIKYRESLPADLSRALTVGLAPWVVLSLAVGFIDAVPIDNAAHIGGLITGALVASVMASRLRQDEVKWTRPILWTLTALAAVVLIWTLAHWSNEVVSCLGSVDDFATCYPQLAAEIAAVRDR